MPYKTAAIPIILFIANVGPLWSFSVWPFNFENLRRRGMPVILHHRHNFALNGVLSRDSIMNASREKSNCDGNSYLNKSFLAEVLDEALFRQTSAMEALDREIHSSKEHKEEAAVVEVSTDESTSEVLFKNTTSRIEARKKELLGLNDKFLGLRSNLEEEKSLSQKQLERIKRHIVDSGYGSIFRQPRSSWKSKQARIRQFGRPQGFDGEVFYSPLGVPILVGRMNAHKDEVMRNAAQGSDLWFQVEDYNGSRVLLRTSLMRGTKGSKQCRQMAADLAAKYSIWGEDYDSVPVMYTDSRKVAKRGSKIGKMKQKKSLGRIMGVPNNIYNTN